MSQRNYVTLILILILTAVVIFLVLPNNPTIPIVNRALSTRLGLDLQGGLQVLLEVDLPQDQPVTAQQLQDAIQVLNNRSNGLGVSEVTFQTAGNRRILGEFPGLTNTQDVIAVLKETGVLEFVDLGSNQLQEGTIIKTDFAQGSSGSTTATAAPTATAQASPTPAASGTPASTETTYHTIMTGADLVADKIAVTTSTVGQYQVAFTLTDKGKKIFADYTTANVGKYLAIVLDKKIISAPVIKNPIPDGSGVIEGGFTQKTANNLAIQLRYGSLPIPLKVAESSAVGATLGQDSVRKSEVAGAIGLAVVILFMGLYYRLPGVLADLALILYALTTFAIYRLIPVTLTLPGIAGFVLSIGVAVDANILIFERLKEELRAGRTLRQAIDLGWRRAWPSIRDSNISTLITCTILFIFGSSFGASMVKGFAVTLALGVLVSLFTAIIVTRTFLHTVLDSLKVAEHPRWFGA